MVIVNDKGFDLNENAKDAAIKAISFEAFLNLAPQDRSTADTIDVSPNCGIEELLEHIDEFAMIRILFDSFADGRGFSLARQLRLAGFLGRLRAVGHVLSDQYPLARRCGFDDVQIDDALAQRQPEHQWLSHRVGSETYQSRLMQPQAA